MQCMKYIILLLFALPSFQTGESQLPLRLPPFLLESVSCSESVISMPHKAERERVGRLLRYLSQNTILNNGMQGAWPDKQDKKDYSKQVCNILSVLTGKSGERAEGVLSKFIGSHSRFLSSLKHRSGYFITGLCKMLI